MRLTPTEIKDLSRLSGFRSTCTILGDWMLVTLLLAFNLRYFHPFTILISMLLMARTQFAFLVLLHDAAHFRLYSSRRLNDIIGQLLIAPIFLSLPAYRNLHLKHHRDPLVPEDPDLALTGGYPISKKSFRRKLLRDLLGISFIKVYFYFLGSTRFSNRRKNQRQKKAQATSKNSSEKKIKQGKLILGGILFNLCLSYACWSLGRVSVYFVIWLMPQMSILQVLLRIRGITEHAGYQPNSDQRLNSRTVVNPVEAFFLAPHNVNYHIEHHLYVSIPFYNLPKAHRILLQRDALPLDNVYTSYRRVLADLIRDPNPL